MQLTRTWIDSNLSYAQRNQLVEYLLERSHTPTGEQIRQALEELFPGMDYPSVNACLNWRMKAWSVELLRRKKRENEQAAIALSKGGESYGLANEKLVQLYLFEQLQALHNNDKDEVDHENLHKLILSAARLSGDARAERKAQAELEIIKKDMAERDAKEAERKRREAEAAKAAESAEKRGGISPEARAIIDQLIGGA